MQSTRMTPFRHWSVVHPPTQPHGKGLQLCLFLPNCVAESKSRLFPRALSLIDKESDRLGAPRRATQPCRAFSWVVLNAAVTCLAVRHDILEFSGTSSRHIGPGTSEQADRQGLRKCWMIELSTSTSPTPHSANVESLARSNAFARLVAPKGNQRQDNKCND